MTTSLPNIDNIQDTSAFNERAFVPHEALANNDFQVYNVCCKELTLNELYLCSKNA
ncbi:18594_t:CDS:1, partial [Funneliformis geosporum]